MSQNGSKNEATAKKELKNVGPSYVREPLTTKISDPSSDECMSSGLVDSDNVSSVKSSFTSDSSSADFTRLADQVEKLTLNPSESDNSSNPKCEPMDDEEVHSQSEQAPENIVKKKIQRRRRKSSSESLRQESSSPMDVGPAEEKAVASTSSAGLFIKPEIIIKPYLKRRRSPKPPRTRSSKSMCEPTDVYSYAGAGAIDYDLDADESSENSPVLSPKFLNRRRKKRLTKSLCTDAVLYSEEGTKEDLSNKGSLKASKFDIMESEDNDVFTLEVTVSSDKQSSDKQSQ